MSPVARLAVVLLVLGLAALVAWLARRGTAIRRRRTTLPSELEPPILFTSETCASCGRVERIVAELGLPRLTEVVWEEEPAVFAAAAVNRVPVFMWRDVDGQVWRVDGVASVSRLRRWMAA